MFFCDYIVCEYIFFFDYTVLVLIGCGILLIIALVVARTPLAQGVSLFR